MEVMAIEDTVGIEGGGIGRIIGGTEGVIEKYID